VPSSLTKSNPSGSKKPTTNEANDNHSIQIQIYAYAKLHEQLPVPPEIHINDPQPGHNRTIRVLSTLAGDERLTWDNRILAEIQAAKKLFMDLVAKGLKPYKVDPTGKKTAEILDSFDPLAEEIIFAATSLAKGG
jgi:hypothetical protein